MHRDEFLACCYHEAGHAVIAEATGFEVESVTFDCTRYVRGPEATDPYPPFSLDAERYLTAVFGGWLADAKVRALGDRPAAASGRDFRAVSAILRRIPPAAKEYLECSDEDANRQVVLLIEGAVRRSLRAVTERWHEVRSLAAMIGQEADPESMSDSDLREATRVSGAGLRSFLGSLRSHE